MVEPTVLKDLLALEGLPPQQTLDARSDGEGIVLDAVGIDFYLQAPITQVSTDVLTEARAEAEDLLPIAQAWRRGGKGNRCMQSKHSW